MKPFEPKAEKAEWRMIYDGLLATAESDTLIPYEDFDKVLGRRLSDNRSPLYRARTELSRNRKKWMEAVPRQGYRVIRANEHLGVAAQHKKKARRQLGIMVKVGDCTDLSKLTSSELVDFDQQQRVNAALFMIVTHHEKRLERIEKLLRSEGRLLD